MSRTYYLALRLIFMAFSALYAQPSFAWWSNDWAYRQQIVVDASKTGADLRDRAYDVPVIVRLHTGNFAFDSAKPDGGDLRVINADDKTPLPFAIERFEKNSGMAILRVLVPTLEPGQKLAVWLYYGNPKAEPATDRTAVRDRLSVMAFDFDQMKAGLKDRTAYGNNAASSSVKPSPGGVIGDAALFAPADMVTVAPAPSLLFSKAGGVSISLWLRFAPGVSGTVATVGNPAAAPLRLYVDGGAIKAAIRSQGGTSVDLATAPVTASGWHHVALTVGANTAILYLDGEEQGRAPTDALPFGGQVALGSAAGEAGFAGAMDDVALDKAVRGPEWIRAVARGNGPTRQMASLGALEQKSQFSAYFTLLGAIVSTVSLDGWVIIGFTLVLGFISAEVTIAKTLQLNRMQKGDQTFLTSDAEGAHPEDFATISPFARIEAVAHRIVDQRGPDGRPPEGALDTVRSAVARIQINEASALNKNMVLMTLTISGAPFLGLLGTVVGVMITFASIAASGDINVNTIAPGISAALACTVAGLIIAIPALFAYNIVMARIRERLTGMDIFGEDVVTRAAQRLKQAGASHAL